MANSPPLFHVFRSLARRRACTIANRLWHTYNETSKLCQHSTHTKLHTHITQHVLGLSCVCAWLLSATQRHLPLLLLHTAVCWVEKGCYLVLCLGCDCHNVVASNFAQDRNVRGARATFVLTCGTAPTAAAELHHVDFAAAC